jgi:DNA-directed RNA polymerase specialized sigma24 family protein
MRDEQRQKRGGALRAQAPRWGEHLPSLDDVVGTEPSPEFAAQVAEECQRLLQKLDKPDLKKIALWKMEGYTNKEIATKLGRVERSIERKLDLIRKTWEKEMTP